MGIHDDAMAAARRFVAERLPLGARITHEWSGVIGWSCDNLPWVGMLPHRPAHYVCAGFSGHGMAQTFLCGKAVAEMIRVKEENNNAVNGGVVGRTTTVAERMWSQLRYVPAFAPNIERRRLRPGVAAPWGSADPQAGAAAEANEQCQ